MNKRRKAGDTFLTYKTCDSWGGSFFKYINPTHVRVYSFTKLAGFYMYTDECEGKCFESWDSDTEKTVPIPLDVYNQGISCLYGFRDSVKGLLKRVPHNPLTSYRTGTHFAIVNMEESFFEVCQILRFQPEMGIGNPHQTWQLENLCPDKGELLVLQLHIYGGDIFEEVVYKSIASLEGDGKCYIISPQTYKKVYQMLDEFHFSLNKLFLPHVK